MSFVLKKRWDSHSWVKIGVEKGVKTVFWVCNQQDATEYDSADDARKDWNSALESLREDAERRAERLNKKGGRLVSHKEARKKNMSEQWWEVINTMGSSEKEALIEDLRKTLKMTGRSLGQVDKNNFASVMAHHDVKIMVKVSPKSLLPKWMNDTALDSMVESVENTNGQLIGLNRGKIYLAKCETGWITFDGEKFSWSPEMSNAKMFLSREAAEATLEDSRVQTRKHGYIVELNVGLEAVFEVEKDGASYKDNDLNVLRSKIEADKISSELGGEDQTRPKRTRRM